VPIEFAVAVARLFDADPRTEQFKKGKVWFEAIVSFEWVFLFPSKPIDCEDRPNGGARQTNIPQKDLS
jgi:hypothetical protein